MNSQDFVHETAVTELTNKLSNLAKQQIALYKPDGKTYRGEKMPTLDNPDDIYNRATQLPLKDIAVEPSEIDDGVKRIIKNKIELFNKKQQQILKLRFWDNMTYQEIADVLRVTPERIRQIEAKIIRRLRIPNADHPEELRQYNENTIPESAVTELTTKLPSLAKHDYNTIDTLMKSVAKKHRITDKLLHDKFLKKHKKSPDSWITDKLKEIDVETGDSSRQREVDKFVDWACGILKIENKPEIELSDDTEEAQNNHHTGGHTPGDDSIWVYAKNRNMVDILRTVFHELVHVRQGELNMIKPGSSYPGSPIEAQADMLAGKYIKIYGAKNHHIFEMVAIPIGSRGRAT